ncbi:GAF domain-containing protein [Nocardia nova SH22a]|uniref:GAF domain-containing protein n=1 Tax=Nocardia nova SH22a TaxID=1415166 RepID=W5TKB9_9NOCA|nr:GAF domain-containing protein [Nocardia nova]AHH19687.1 GAF domain-containing protein [Nocardia nova SH22a]
MPDPLVRPLSKITADLVRDADLTNTLPLIAQLGAQELDAAAPALVIPDLRGAVRVLPAGAERPGPLHILEAHTTNGPWTESMSTMEPNAVTIDGDDGRWPDLSRDALAAGYHAICAAPMILGTRSVGSFVLFYERPVEFDPDHRTTAQTLADLVTLSLCQDSDSARAELLAGRALTIFDDRVRYEHAIGMTAGRLDIDIQRATALLQAHADTHDLPLVVLSRSITSGTFDWTELDA